MDEWNLECGVCYIPTGVIITRSQVPIVIIIVYLACRS